MRALRIAMRVAAVALIGAALAVWWLLGSGGGRDLVLDRLVAALPADSLRIGEREGSLAGGLRLRGVVYDDGSVRVEIDEVAATPRWPGVWTPALNLSRVSVQGLRVAIVPAPDAPPTRWPDALPRLALPVDVAINALDVVDAALATREAATASVGAVAPAAERLRIDRWQAAVRLVDGGLAVDDLHVEAPPGRLQGDLRYAPAEDVAARAHLALQLAAGARLAIAVEGGLAAGTVAIDGEAGGPVQLSGAWRDAGAAETLAWTLEAALTRLDAAALGLPAQPPIDAALRLQGGAGVAREAPATATAGHPVALEGRLVRDGQAVALRPSRLRLDGERLHAEPLALSLLDGRIDLLGHYGLDDGQAAFDAAVDSITWGDGEAQVRASGTARLEGTLEDWTAALALDLRRSGQPARLEATVSGDAEAIVLAPLSLTTPGGALRGEGRLALDAERRYALDADLQRVDPAWLLPGWPGRLDARLGLTGALPSDAPRRFDLKLGGLRGTLRGVAIAGAGRLRGEGPVFALEADLAAGEGTLQVEGRVAPALDLRVAARSLALAPWLAGWRGVLDGRLELDGEASRPGLDADLVLLDAGYGDLSAQRVALRGRLPARAEGAMTLQAEGLSRGGTQVDTLALTFAGAIEQAQVVLEARSDRGRLSAAGGWQAEAGFERGTLALDRLDAGGPGLPSLVLAAPGRVDWSAAGPALPAPLCLRIGREGRLCAEGDGDAFDLRGESLRLAWLASFLSETPPGALPRMDALALQATLRREDGARLLRADLRSDGLQVDLNGRWAENDAIAGELALRATDLAWAELLSADLAAPSGRLEGRLQFSGTMAQPRWQGQLVLAPFSAELPALGIGIRDGSVRLQGGEDGRLMLDGRLPTGDGALELGGQWSPGGGGRLVLRGADVRVLDTADGQAWISPELDVALADGVARVTGRVAMPRASLRLDRFEQTVAASPDVVVVDDPTPTESAAGLRLDADLRLVLGDDVRLRGFGFDGRLAGELRVRDRLDREPRASGALALSGRLAAYGQQLELTRGAIRWANAPIDEPTLDVRAERPDTQPRVGVALSGSALAPVAEVWSTPPLPQAEALSWLMFGQPLASADGEDAAQLQDAATSLGGSAVAQAVASRVGLDAASVGQSRALGGTAVTVGKRITPKLYVSYGVALSGAGQVVTVTYALRRWLAAKLESGTEQRAELEVRFDRD